MEAPGPSAPGQGSRLSLHSLKDVLAASLCVFISLEEAERPPQHQQTRAESCFARKPSPSLDRLGPLGFFLTRAPQSVHRLSQGLRPCQQVFGFDRVNFNFLFRSFNDEFKFKDLACRARENQAILGLGLQLRGECLTRREETLG